MSIGQVLFLVLGVGVGGLLFIPLSELKGDSGKDPQKCGH